MGAVFFRVLYASSDYSLEVKERRNVEVTDYEIISLVIAVIGLLVGIVSLLLKLFAYLDSRYKRK